MNRPDTWPFRRGDMAELREIAMGRSMTVQPETRFRCDRCEAEAILPVSNTPAQTRFAPPEEWMTLQVDNLDLRNHLCPSCTQAYRDFMERRT